ncbi:hypothetical protein ASE95_02925 [Sphingomonas sp. Leaf231]|nr:hypothetical protein ASE95_02925 [Sphingomonas sp. Leaf231]
MAAQVEDGRMSQAEADASIAAARAIVMEWHWMLDPRLPALPARWGADQDAMLAQLQRLAPWARRQWDAAPENKHRRERALLVEALLWHQDLAGGDMPRIVHFGLLARRNPSWRWKIDPAEDAGIFRALGLPLRAEVLAA